MKRREFIMLLGCAAAAWPPAVRAQQSKKLPRIGFLSPISPAASVHWHEAFRQGLRERGWIEGNNVTIEYRYAAGRADRLPELATDLVRLGVDIIVASSNTDAEAAKNATRTIPIVVASGGDPVGSGLVESLARPGGNITGLSQMAPDLAGKRLELLKEIVPNLSRVAVLWNPLGTTSPLGWKEVQVPARQLGIELQSLEVRSAKEFEQALESAGRARVGALAIMPDPLFAGNLKRIADLAIKNRLPSIFHIREFVEEGGLVAYGVDRSDMFRRAAGYVDQILKGAKPADLPIMQPTKFELAINLKAAKIIGLEIPPMLLARADEVIE